MNISVIIPVYNGAKYIVDAINSIINQTISAKEIIVIDDGSTDNSAALVKYFSNVTYYYQNNAGVAAARNYGLKLANGDFIAFLDHDDVYPPNKLEVLYNKFQEDNSLMVAIGSVKYRFENEKIKEKFNEIHLQEITNHVLIGAALFKKDVFDIVGIFDTNLLMADDFDWYERLYTSKVKIIRTNECCLIYRKHFSNGTNNVAIAKKGLLLALRKAIARKNENNA